jgi:hypothetical protein
MIANKRHCFGSFKVEESMATFRFYLPNGDCITPDRTSLCPEGEVYISPETLRWLVRQIMRPIASISALASRCFQPRLAAGE